MTRQNIPGEVMPDSWWDEHAITAQGFRIAMSGLKSEPGAFESSRLRAEIAAGEWGPTPDMIAIEKKRLAVVRRKNAIARQTMPPPRKRQPTPGDWIALSCGHKMQFPIGGRCDQCEDVVL